jgi:hypothetical protein
MDWGYLFFIVLVVGAFAVFGDVIALGAVLGLGYQAVKWLQTGEWPSYTLGNQLHLPLDFEPTHWVIVDRVIRFIVFDTEIAFILVIAAGLANPIKDWLGRGFNSTRAVPAKAPNSSGGSQASKRP